MMSFADIPEEILIHIFSYYIESEGQVTFLQNVVPVCKSWLKASSCPAFWRTADFRGEQKDRRRDLFNLIRASEKGLLGHSKVLRLRYHLLNIRVIGKIFYSCSNLERLDLDTCRVDRSFFEYVAEHCVKLNSLRLHKVTENCKTIGGKSLEPIIAKRGRSLKCLDLSHVRMKGYYGDQFLLQVASSCPMLEELRLESFIQGTRYLKFPAVDFMVGCPRLRKLSLQHCAFSDPLNTLRVDGAGLPGFPELVHFEALSVRWQSDLKGVLSRACRLKHLSIELVIGLPDRSILQCPSVELEAFCVRGSEFYRDDFLDEIILKWKHSLKQLECHNIGQASTDRALCALLSEQYPRPPLEALSLRSSRFSVSVLKAVLYHCSNLKKLDTTSCKHLRRPHRRLFDTPGSLNALRESLSTDMS